MTQERFARLVAGVLLVGVSMSAVLIGIGLVAALFVGWDGAGTAAAVGGVPPDPSDFSDLGPRLRALQPLAISQLGLLVLIATPVVRVACSVVGYAMERDRLYVAITGTVLLILLASLLLFH